MILGRALVTGASNGIGRAVAVQLSEKGYDLVLVSRNQKGLAETAALCKTDAIIIATDLSSPDAIMQLIKRIQDLDRLDVIFYSHGVHQRVPFLEESVEAMQHDYQLYVSSILQIDNALLPMIIKSKNSLSQAIIYMGSVSSVLSSANNGSYAMCKHALKAHAESLFEEVRETGVKISTLFPGYINSREHTHAQLDPNKLIQVSDIVLAVEFCLSLSAAACATGIYLRPQYSPNVS